MEGLARHVANSREEKRLGILRPSFRRSEVIFAKARPDPAPNEVFVPGKFPIENHNVYADRGNPQQRFLKAIERNFVPVLYGGYGVGKSSMARHLAKKWHESNRLVYIPSLYGKSLEDIFAVVLETVGYSVVTERTTASTNETTAEASSSLEGGFFGVLKATFTPKYGTKRSSVGSVRSEVVIKSPTDVKILQICEENSLLLLLDEAHRADARLKDDLGAFLKAYANSSPGNFLIAILGTEKDASKLVTRDPGIDRLIQEVELKYLEPDEANYILAEGMQRLSLTYSRHDGKKVIRCAVGSPFVLQYLCLEIAEKCRNEGRSAFDANDIKFAIAEYATAKEQRALANYKLAIETTGPKRYRKQILHAMAEIEDDYVTMEQLVSGVSRLIGEETPRTVLSGPLRDLKSAQYGSILTDIEGIDPEKRAFNYSAFTDPAIKSVIRLVNEVQQHGDLTPEELLIN